MIDKVRKSRVYEDSIHLRTSNKGALIAFMSMALFVVHLFAFIGFRISGELLFANCWLMLASILFGVLWDLHHIRHMEYEIRLTELDTYDSPLYSAHRMTDSGDLRAPGNRSFPPVIKNPQYG